MSFLINLNKSIWRPLKMDEYDISLFYCMVRSKKNVSSYITNSRFKMEIDSDIKEL